MPSRRDCTNRSSLARSGRRHTIFPRVFHSPYRAKLEIELSRSTGRRREPNTSAFSSPCRLSAPGKKAYCIYLKKGAKRIATYHRLPCILCAQCLPFPKPLPPFWEMTCSLNWSMDSPSLLFFMGGVIKSGRLVPSSFSPCAFTQFPRNMQFPVVQNLQILRRNPKGTKPIEAWQGDCSLLIYLCF